MTFKQTDKVLVVENEATYLIFTTKSPVTSNYFHAIERKDYIVRGLYSGDEKRYYKHEDKIEYVNTVTGQITIMDQKYRIGALV